MCKNKREININQNGDTGWNQINITPPEIDIYRLIIIFGGILIGAIIAGTFIVLLFWSKPEVVTDNTPNSSITQKSSDSRTSNESGTITGTNPEIMPTKTSAVIPSATSIPTPTKISTPSPSKLDVKHILASGHANPSRDSELNTVTYEPDKAIDGNISTAWRISGNGIDEWIHLDFGDSVELYEIGIIPGYSKIDPYDGSDRFVQNYVLKKVRLEFSTGDSMIFTFSHNREMQYLDLEGFKTTFIRIVILDTYPPRSEEERNYTPISEIEVIGWKK